MLILFVAANVFFQVVVGIVVRSHEVLDPVFPFVEVACVSQNVQYVLYACILLFLVYEDDAVVVTTEFKILSKLLLQHVLENFGTLLLSCLFYLFYIYICFGQA